MIMKNYFILSFLFLLTACGSKTLPKQDSLSYKSGTVNYDISLDLFEESAGLEETFGKSATATFNQHYLHFIKNTGVPNETFQIFDFMNNEVYSFMQVKNKKISFPFSNKHSPITGELIYLEESKPVAGHLCRKAQATTKHGLMEIYYTNDIAANYCPYLDLKGFALEYSIDMPYGKVTYTASNVDLKHVNQDIVNIPTDYEQIEEEDLDSKMTEIVAGKRKDNYKRDFTINDLYGESLTLSSLSKVVVVNFWFTTCPPCVREIPLLNELKEELKEEDVSFLAVTYDNEQTVRNFLKAQEFNFRIIPDAHHLVKDYDIFVYPTTLVLDESGEIVDMKMGGSQKIKEEIKTSILKELGK